MKNITQGWDSGGPQGQESAADLGNPERSIAPCGAGAYAKVMGSGKETIKSDTMIVSAAVQAELSNIITNCVQANNLLTSYIQKDSCVHLHFLLIVTYIT